jgi:hypothetical protein
LLPVIGLTDTATGIVVSRWGVHGEALAGVGAAAGVFADHGCAAELLQVVAELLAARECRRASQHVHRLGLAEPAARHIRQGPHLPGRGVLAFPQAGELDRVMVP